MSCPKKLRSKKCFVQKLFGQIKIGAEKIWTQNNLRSKTRWSQEPIYKVWSKSCQWQLRYSWYGQMSRGQMLPEQMLLWYLEYVRKDPRNQPPKFGQNRTSNSWDIADMDKCRKDKCCMDKCLFDNCLRLSRVNG